MRFGFGFSLAQPRLLGLSGAGVPSDALGNLGDRYYDTTNARWYLKRWVGNFLNDSVDIPVAGPANGTTDSWDAELLFRGNLPTAISNDTIFAHLSSVGVPHSRLQKDNNGDFLSFKARASDGSALFAASALTQSVKDSAWHRVKFGVRGALAYLQVDSGSEVTVSLAGWTPPVATKTLLSDKAPAVDNEYQLADVKVSRSGTLLYLVKLADGSGSVASDSSGNGYHGVISDGTPTTFWYQSWVPMDLL